MKKLIISNDWRSIQYSEEFKEKFKDISGRDCDSLSFEEKRTDDTIIALLKEMGGYAFEGQHSGVTVIGFDDRFIHPLIEFEEYGGENLVWLEGSFDEFGIEEGYCYTYNPMYDEEDDDYFFNGEESQLPDYLQYIGESFTIEGSLQVMESLIEEASSEIAKKYASSIIAYHDTGIENVKDILSLKDEDEMKSYLYIYAATSINREYILPLSKTFTKDQIFHLREELEKFLKEKSFDDFCKKIFRNHL